MALQPEPTDVLSAGSRVYRRVVKPLSKVSLVACALLLCVAPQFVGAVRADDTCLDPSCRETVGPDTTVPLDSLQLDSGPTSEPHDDNKILEKPSDDKPPSDGTEENRPPPTVGGRAG